MRGEGDVAAFLYDLTDGGNGESFDQVALPAWYVVDLIKLCRVTWNNPNFSNRVTAIDALIHCLERAPVNVQSTYFEALRFGLATQVTPNVAAQSGGTAAQIRTLWLRDLYSQ